MASIRKICDTVLSGRADTNVRFADLCRLLEYLGFLRRIKGGHHIYWRQGIEEILNLQALKGGGAKPYQVKQVRQIMLKYRSEIPESSQ
jgi:hypothetical protein